MLTCNFRPWGLLWWVIDKINCREWSMLGAIATGDRSLATWEYLKDECTLNFYKLLKVEDIPSPYWGDEPQIRMNERLYKFINSGGKIGSIIDCNILDPAGVINDIAIDFISSSSSNIIIDISSLPKRFFFPLVKVITSRSTAENIVICYTSPETHDRAKPLAIDPEPWHNLSHFPPPYPEPPIKKLIVGLGYEPLGLPQLIKGEEFKGVDIRLLFPFPANPEGYLRNWEFVRNLDSEVGRPYIHDPLRVDAYDVSSIYDVITSIADNGNEYVMFAPYGTKTMSLAMCLYATCRPDLTAVYYTQPKSYNPKYSTGIKTIRNKPAIYAYCVRIAGKDLYN